MGAVFWSSVRYLFVTLPDCFFLADQQSRDEKTTELREFLSVEPKSYRKDARLKREKRNCGVRCDVRISLLNAFESTHPTADGNVSRLNGRGESVCGRRGSSSTDRSCHCCRDTRESSRNFVPVARSKQKQENRRQSSFCSAEIFLFYFVARRSSID